MSARAALTDLGPERSTARTGTELVLACCGLTGWEVLIELDIVEIESISPPPGTTARGGQKSRFDDMEGHLIKLYMQWLKSEASLE